jgi:hypothetical protein
MKSEPVVPAIVVVAVIAAVSVIGCGESPGLSGRQVDQFLDVQQTMADEQKALGRGRDDLETDRRIWSERERGDPIIASAIQSAALLTACCLPVIVLIGLLFRHGRQQPDFDVAEELLLEMQSDQAGPPLLETKDRDLPMLEDRRIR